ncbi:40854_t:CDS:2, partial [Gigaspora margarita]
MNISTSASDILNQISNLCYICQEPIKKPVTVLEYDYILYFNFRNCHDRIKNIEAVEEDISNLAEALKPKNTFKLRKADAEKLKELLKILTLLYIAQNKIVADIKKLLPSDTSINVIKKRIATARKIYDIFSTIDEIEFIKTGDNKSKFRIERGSSNIWTDFNVLQSNDPKGLNS